MQPLKYKIFQFGKNGFVTWSRTRKALDGAAHQATEWMNSVASDVEIVHVAIGQESNLSHVVVWYRESAR